MEFQTEVEQNHEQELTNLRVLVWLHDLSADPDDSGCRSVHYQIHQSRQHRVELDRSRCPIVLSQNQP